MSIFDIFKSSSKNKADKYERNNDLPAKEEVLGHSLYKRDINGLKAYLDDMPNMRNIYTEFTWAIRNDYSVEKYLIKANIMNDEEIKDIVKKGFIDIASFLNDMSEIKENPELSIDLNACIEAINLLEN
jgi:hypothetical protein|tara:strand:- start:205 stop:591 length:387 start_codon:yes stop_codon:yes gene_type:complete